jgi:hypothetical protein
VNDALIYLSTTYIYKIDFYLTGTAPFDVEYRMIYAKHQSAWQVEVKFLGEVIHLPLFPLREVNRD